MAKSVIRLPFRPWMADKLPEPLTHECRVLDLATRRTSTRRPNPDPWPPAPAMALPA